MKRKELFLLCIFLLTIFSQVYGQGYKTPFGERKIGEGIPDFALDLLGSSQPNRISNFKGKSLILAFWSITCSSCIKKFPYLDSIQQEYARNLQILLVNIKYSNHTNEKIKEIINKVSLTHHKNIDIPVILAETYQNSASIWDYFKSEKVTVVPHYVWINKEGKLQAITGSKEVTRSNIEYFIANDKITLPIKDDAKIMIPENFKSNNKQK